MTDREGCAIDFAAMRRMFDEDEELIADVIGLFLEDYPVQLASLRAAYAAGDRAGIRRDAHTIKGCTSNFCAAEVVQVARTLEELSETGDLGAIGRGVALLASGLERMAGALREWQAAGVEPAVEAR